MTRSLFFYFILFVLFKFNRVLQSGAQLDYHPQTSISQDYLVGYWR